MNQERKLVMTQTQRTKSILMLCYYDQRKRMNLDKKIQKKQQDAEDT